MTGERKIGKSFLKSIFRDEKGTALTEFAIVAPFYVILWCGVVDIGEVCYHHLVLNQMVREAVRLAESIPELESGANYVGENYVNIPFGQDSLNPGQPPCQVSPSPNQCQVQERLRKLRDLEGRLRLSNFSITSSYDSTTTIHQVTVHITANYRMILMPMDIPIGLTKIGSYLYSS